MPVPNCFCVICRECTGGGYQVLSQGSGDLVASLSTGLWNGREILPLTDAERMKILDFYNQHVSTSYCLALAYTPLVQSTPLMDEKKPVGDGDGQTLPNRDSDDFPVLKLPSVS